MLYILTEDYHIDVFTAPGTLCKPTSHCPCTSCDVACERCNTLADCPHDDDGHDGGVCISVPDGDDWKRLAYYRSFRMSADCACPGPRPCAHIAPLVAEAQKHAPGSRAAGLRKQRFLHTRPELRKQRPVQINQMS